MMEYRGYTAAITYDSEDRCFTGRANGVRDVIHFQADTAEGLEAAFREAIDDYLEDCDEQGRRPDSPASGKHPLKMSADLHHRARSMALARGQSFNAFAVEAIEEAVEKARAEAIRVDQT